MRSRPLLLLILLDAALEIARASFPHASAWVGGGIVVVGVLGVSALPERYRYRAMAWSLGLAGLLTGLTATVLRVYCPLRYERDLFELAQEAIAVTILVLVLKPLVMTFLTVAAIVLGTASTGTRSAIVGAAAAIAMVVVHAIAISFLTPCR